MDRKKGPHCTYDLDHIIEGGSQYQIARAKYKGKELILGSVWGTRILNEQVAGDW